MADGESVVTPGMSKEEVNQILKTHRDEINNMFDERHNKIMEDIRTLGAGDKREREQLELELKELKEWKESQLKKEKEAQETKGDQHTLVVPPENIPPPTPPAPVETNQEPSKRGFLDLW